MVENALFWGQKKFKMEWNETVFLIINWIFRDLYVYKEMGTFPVYSSGHKAIILEVYRHLTPTDSNCFQYDPMYVGYSCSFLSLPVYADIVKT